MKYRPHNRSVYFWPWKDFRAMAPQPPSLRKTLWRSMCVYGTSSGAPGRNPKLSLCFPSGSSSRISSLLTVAWRSQAELCAVLLTGWLCGKQPGAVLCLEKAWRAFRHISLHTNQKTGKWGCPLEAHNDCWSIYQRILSCNPLIKNLKT